MAGRNNRRPVGAHGAGRVPSGFGVRAELRGPAGTLRPDWVDIISADRGDYSRQVVGYIYRRNNGQADGSAEFYTTDEVAHWSPIPDPLAQWRGMSWLTPVVREVNADSAMTTHKRAFFDNAATPNMIIKYAQKLNDDAIEKLSAQWQATHGGPRNGWKTAVLDNGADPTIIGHSFEQMNFATVQAAGENRIAAAAGVPGIVVGLKEGLQAATYSNYEQAMRRFADLTMRPLWRSATAALATLISVPTGHTAVVRHRRDSRATPGRNGTRTDVQGKGIHRHRTDSRRIRPRHGGIRR